MRIMCHSLRIDSDGASGSAYRRIHARRAVVLRPSPMDCRSWTRVCTTRSSAKVQAQALTTDAKPVGNGDLARPWVKVH